MENEGIFLKKISLVQMATVFGKSEENYRKIEELLEKSLHSLPDIIVFPETINVGFFPKENLEKMADVDGMRTKKLFSEFAKKHNVNIVGGSVAVVKGTHIYNTCYVFNRVGDCVCEYDKIHGFTLLNEHSFFKGGDKIANFELDGFKCSVIICYDLRFVELARTLALQGTQMLFIPAQWPLVRKLAWETLCRARAIENQMYICAVNAAGYFEDHSKCGGNSLLISPEGEEILHLGEQEEIQTASVDFSLVLKVRETINVFRDRRPEIYNVN